MGQSAEWAAAPPTDQAAVIGLLIDGASMVGRVVGAALGAPGKPPPPLPAADADDEPDTLADLGAIEPARAVAAGVLFAGRLGLIHGPSGGGKTTALANVIARVTTGRPWLGQPTIPGAVVIACEEAATWGHTVKAAGGDLRRVYLRRWRNLPAAVEELRPVAIVVDTMQFIAHETGSAELDSAQAVDAILRPLERLCREYGCAVAVTDHEPWADPSAGASRDRESGTQKRPRHSGAKVATADYILRITTADNVTTISRGAKVRWGIAIEPAVSVDIRGERVSAPTPPAAESRRKVQGMDGTTTLTDTETYDRMFGFLTRTPDTWQSTRKIRERSGIRAASVPTVLDQLTAAGRVEKRSGPRNSTLYRVVPGAANPTPPEPREPLAYPRPVPTGSRGSQPHGNQSGTTPGTTHATGSRVVPDPIGEPLTGTTHGNHSASGSRATEPGTTQGATATDRKGPAPPDRSAAFLKPPPPPCPASRTASGQHGRGESRDRERRH